jgi:hypothetical protein
MNEPKQKISEASNQPYKWLSKNVSDRQWLIILFHRAGYSLPSARAWVNDNVVGYQGNGYPILANADHLDTLTAVIDHNFILDREGY